MFILIVDCPMLVDLQQGKMGIKYCIIKSIMVLYYSAKADQTSEGQSYSGKGGL